MKFARILFVLIILNSCKRQVSRPSNISSDAFYLGGSDGGVWLDTSVINASCLNIIVIWDTGDTAGIFNYEISRFNNSDSVVNDIRGFDGEKIVFINNGYLMCP